MTSLRIAPQRTTLPLLPLVTLSVIGFATMLTETIPAGLLGDIGGSLHTSDSATGQLLTVYAAASMVAAIPLTTLTRAMPRKPLLLATVICVAAANIITAVSSEFYLTALARIIAGAAAGVQWAMLAGYAMRMVDQSHKGRALSVAMAGIPIALAFGIPLGTLLGAALGWRGVFAVLAMTGLLAAMAASLVLPRFDGETGEAQTSLKSVLSRPGIVVIMLCALLFQAAHMNAYTYVEPYLKLSGLDDNISVVLLCLGIAAIAGLWATGALIDRHLVKLALTVSALFCIATATMGIIATVAPTVVIAAVVWGFALGCAPTIYQTACARAAGAAVDLAQAVLVTLFNAGMALGSLIGGVALSTTDNARTLPWISLALFLIILAALGTTKATSLPKLGSDDR